MIREINKVCVEEKRRATRVTDLVFDSSVRQSIARGKKVLVSGLCTKNVSVWVDTTYKKAYLPDTANYFILKAWPRRLVFSAATKLVQTALLRIWGSQDAVLLVCDVLRTCIQTVVNKRPHGYLCQVLCEQNSLKRLIWRAAEKRFHRWGTLEFRRNHDTTKKKHLYTVA